LSAEKGHTETCALLLERGANVHAKDMVSFGMERKGVVDRIESPAFFS
jgi:hypothetical protein